MRLTTAATLETGELRRPKIVNCVAHLRAFAVMLAGDCQRADDLVRDTVLQTFTAADRPIAMIRLKVQMFAGLRKLHYAALRQSTAASARDGLKQDGIESDELLGIFGRIRDEQREALILTVAAGLSHEQAAEVCDCDLETIKSRVLGSLARDIADEAGGLASDKSNWKRSVRRAPGKLDAVG
jgi:RNA polymerase sigma-70 factor, ECF subfamily